MKLSMPRATSILPVLMVIGLAGCEAPDRKADYREQHPLNVGREIVELAITSRPEFEPLSFADQDKLKKFVTDFHMRGAGPLTVRLHRREAAAGDGVARVRKMRALLNRAGISAGQISVLPLSTKVPRGAAVLLSFTANTVALPKCNDWSSDPNFNWSNRSQANYGCATRRNIGMTVANPGDLKKAQPLSGSDSVRGARILGGYRAGTPAGGGGDAGAAP